MLNVVNYCKEDTSVMLWMWYSWFKHLCIYFFVYWITHFITMEKDLSWNTLNFIVSCKNPTGQVPLWNLNQVINPVGFVFVPSTYAISCFWAKYSAKTKSWYQWCMLTMAQSCNVRYAIIFSIIVSLKTSTWQNDTTYCFDFFHTKYNSEFCLNGYIVWVQSSSIFNVLSFAILLYWMR